MSDRVVIEFQRDIAELRQELAIYEDGWRARDKRGLDVTERCVARINTDIAEYQRIINARLARTYRPEGPHAPSLVF